MLIFYPRTTDSPLVTPLVLIDALCSDDRFSTKEIAFLVKQCAPQLADPIGLLPHKVFSTEYEYTYSRRNAPPDAAVKSEFTGMIKSPPAEFVTAFSPAWFLSSQNIDQMNDAASKVANAQTAYVYASACSRAVDGKTLKLDFVAYRAESVPDPFGVSTTLLLHGALIDDIILTRLDSGFTLDDKALLTTQLTALASSFGFKTEFTLKSNFVFPVSKKLFPPQTLNRILGGICYQNKLLFYMDYETKTVKFYSQGSGGTPKNRPLNTLQMLSFLGAGGRLLISNFTVSNFAQANFSTQFFPVQPFDSLLVVNDAKSGVFEGATVAQKLGKFDVYLYYVLAYAYRWSREMYELQISATNNWLLSQNKVDTLLETGVWKAANARAG